MEWEDAKEKIAEKVGKLTDLNTTRSRKSDYRYVLSSPPPHFDVPIAQKERVYVPWDMLEKCWSKMNEVGKYDTHVFGGLFPKEKKSHGCYVHVVGKIFQQADLVDSHDDKYYTLKK